ncbi:uncharacterized protein METZ01_LOCUS229671, partial [marine metagenome]
TLRRFIKRCHRCCARQRLRFTVLTRLARTWKRSTRNWLGGNNGKH